MLQISGDLCKKMWRLTHDVMMLYGVNIVVTQKCGDVQ